MNTHGLYFLSTQYTYTNKAVILQTSEMLLCGIYNGVIYGSKLSAIGCWKVLSIYKRQFISACVEKAEKAHLNGNISALVSQSL
jgi:hypothetical protein